MGWTKFFFSALAHPNGPPPNFDQGRRRHRHRAHNGRDTFDMPQLRGVTPGQVEPFLGPNHHLLDPEYYERLRRQRMRAQMPVPWSMKQGPHPDGRRGYKERWAAFQAHSPDTQALMAEIHGGKGGNGGNGGRGGGRGGGGGGGGGTHLPQGGDDGAFGWAGGSQGPGRGGGFGGGGMSMQGGGAHGGGGRGRGRGRGGGHHGGGHGGGQFG